MASIIEKVDIKGDTKPEFVVVKGDLEELEAFVDSGMRTDLHIAVQPSPVLIGDTNETGESQLLRLESLPHGARRNTVWR